MIFDNLYWLKTGFHMLSLQRELEEFKDDWNIVKTLLGTHCSVSYIEKNSNNLQEKISCSRIGDCEMFFSCYFFFLFSLFVNIYQVLE